MRLLWSRVEYEAAVGSNVRSVPRRNSVFRISKIGNDLNGLNRCIVFVGVMNVDAESATCVARGAAAPFFWAFLLIPKEEPAESGTAPAHGCSLHWFYLAFSLGG